MRLIRLLKNDLAKEASEWVKEKIISQSQAEEICARYNVDFNQSKNRSFGYNVLVSLGYLFIGLALITLIGANWDDIPRALRMTSLIALTMATHAFAIKKLSANETNKATGLFLLGNIFYGASIILIAQIYHLGEHMPDGVFWWALGCLPIGVLVSSSWITLQSLLLAIIWFFLEVDLGFYPTLFPIFIIGSIYVLFRGQQSTLLFLATIVSIACWIEYSLAVLWSNKWYFDFHVEHIAVSVAMFIFTYLFSHFLNQQDSVKAKDYGALLSIWSLRFGLIVMLILSFEDPWRELIKAHWDHQLSMLTMVSLFLIAALLLAAKTKHLITAECISLFYLATLATVQLTHNTDYASYFQIAYNLVLIAFGSWLVIQGINHGISHYFFLGVSTILLTAFMRYVDLIGDYIGGATLFIVFAALLLGAAKYWKHKHSNKYSS